jgi:hypothetical protein
MGVSAEQQLAVHSQHGRAELTTLAPAACIGTNCVQRSNRLQTKASAVFMIQILCDPKVLAKLMLPSICQFLVCRFWLQ